MPISIHKYRNSEQQVSTDIKGLIEMFCHSFTITKQQQASGKYDFLHKFPFLASQLCKGSITDSSHKNQLKFFGHCMSFVIFALVCNNISASFHRNPFNFFKIIPQLRRAPSLTRPAPNFRSMLSVTKEFYSFTTSSGYPCETAVLANLYAGV